MTGRVAWFRSPRATVAAGTLIVVVALSMLLWDRGFRSALPPSPPPGMVYVPGGVTDIGSEDGPLDERPVFAARVEPFFMDVHPVTVADFRKFVEATGHVTDAERHGNGGIYDIESGDWRRQQPDPFCGSRRSRPVIIALRMGRTRFPGSRSRRRRGS